MAERALLPELPALAAPCSGAPFCDWEGAACPASGAPAPEAVEAGPAPPPDSRRVTPYPPPPTTTIAAAAAAMRNASRERPGAWAGPARLARRPPSALPGWVGEGPVPAPSGASAAVPVVSAAAPAG